jgi:hypothetical protein
MSKELCEIEKPEYVLTKEYTDKPNDDDLTEMFIVVYKIDLANWEKEKEEDCLRYIFFCDLEKAFKRFKLFGPGRAMLKRIFTDNEELIKLGRASDSIKVELQEDELHQIKATDSEVNNEDSDGEGAIKRIRDLKLGSEIEQIMKEVNEGKTSGSV